MRHPVEAAITPLAEVDYYVWHPIQTRSVVLSASCSAVASVAGVAAFGVILSWLGVYPITGEWWHPGLIALAGSALWGSWHFGRQASTAPWYVGGRIEALRAEATQNRADIDAGIIIDEDAEDDPIVSLHAAKAARG